MKTLCMVAAVIAFGWTRDARADEHEAGPHKGAIIEWGEEEYHLEIVTDAKTGDVMVYVYGDHKEFHKEKTRAIDAKSLSVTIKGDKAVTVKLEPKPGKDDPKGTSTVFVGKDDAVKTEKKLSGSVSGKVGTKPYTGDFKQK